MPPSTSPDAATRIAAITAYYAAHKTPLLPILHAVQAEFGFIPDEAIPLIAAAQNLSQAEILGTLSFYPDFRRRPAGRHVLRLCRAEACLASGAQEIACHTQSALNIGWHQTTPDGAVTLEPVFCLGLCSAAPCAQINDRTLVQITSAKIDSLLESLP